MLKYKSPWGGEYEVAFELDNYIKGNKGTYLQMWSYNGEYDSWEPETTVTVNLDKTYYHSNDSKDIVYIDEEYCPYLSDWLAENNLAKLTGRWGFSGYCSYVQMELNRAEIEKHLLKETVR